MRGDLERIEGEEEDDAEPYNNQGRPAASRRQEWGREPMATDERWKHDGVRVIPGTELDPNTPQTPGMDRKAAITFARVGAQKLWAGTVHIHANAKTGAHHHGP